MPAFSETTGRDLLPAINALLVGCQTLLDVGAGTGQTLSGLEVSFKLGLDIHRPYLEHWPPSLGGAVPLHLPAERLSRVFLEKTVDAVTFIDSLEHLPFFEAKEVLAAAERIARRLVAVFTPRGAFNQRDYDAWNLDGERHQQHRWVKRAARRISPSSPLS